MLHRSASWTNSFLFITIALPVYIVHNVPSKFDIYKNENLQQYALSFTLCLDFPKFAFLLSRANAVFIWVIPNIKAYTFKQSYNYSWLQADRSSFPAIGEE